VILDVAHNPHAAAYLAGRLKTLAKTGRVLAVIGMLHDKDIAGTLANLAPEVDAWYCAPLEGPRGATAEQLVEHLRAAQSIAAWRRRGMRRWLTLKWKIPCWCVVRFTRWHMLWKR
jgi:dihydrofolate synthase/folylpolyglutamate synthase